MANYVIVNGELYHCDQLYHHGIKGMKWGKRRWQNKDGSLTPAGEKRYNSAGDVKSTKAAYKQANKEYNKSFNKAYNRASAAYSPFKKHREANDKRWEDAANKAEAANKAKQAYKDAKFKAKVDRDNAKEIEKYAKKGYAQDSYNSNKTVLGKAYDKYTGAHKIAGRMKYEMSTDAERKQRAEKYKAEEMSPEKIAARRKKALKVGAAVAGTALAAYGAYKLNEYVKTKNYQIAAKNGHDYALKSFSSELRAYKNSPTDFSNMTDGYRRITSSGRVRVDEAVKRASNDNFAKAAKNVINYKRTGNSLRDLHSIEAYKDLAEREIVFGKRRR